MKLAVAQSYTLETLSKTLNALRKTTEAAAADDVDILLFPEAYLGGYPRTCSFGAAVGSRTDEGREQFLQYFKSCVDLGDTPTGAGDEWVRKQLPAGADGRRGDGTREYLEEVARETGVFIVTGLVERAGGSLFCAAVYIDPSRGMIGKRRKVMPTGSERLVWSQGTADTLKAVTTVIRGTKITMAAAICWENMMPLLRYSIYSQNVNLWLAPTADPRDTWESLMKTVAMEGRCFVMSANQCQKRHQLPEWITRSGGNQSGGLSEPDIDDEISVGAPRTHSTGEAMLNGKNDATKAGTINGTSSTSKVSGGDEYVSRGGSCIVGPMGKTVAGPVWENSDELITTWVDFDDCARGKLDFDAAGHYARHDQFQLSVAGLSLYPPS